MRAVTAAYAEKRHFVRGKILVSGASKNGASPSVALIADDRITAQHAMVSPIWDSPLRLCDPGAWKALEKVNASFAEELKNDKVKLKKANIGNHYFLGGTYGPIYNKAALSAGHSWEDLRKLSENLADHIFISRNLDKLAERNVDLLFHPGTHDFVAFDIQWGGANYPQIPVYLKANTGHGFGKGHPAAATDEQNLPAFLLSHFFGDMDPMLSPPEISHSRHGNMLSVSVKFLPGSGEENGRFWWMFDRYPDGSAGYIIETFPEEQWTDMEYDESKACWIAELELPEQVYYIDFFSTHGKTLERATKQYKTYISSPYTRIKLME